MPSVGGGRNVVNTTWAAFTKFRFLINCLTHPWFINSLILLSFILEFVLNYNVKGDVQEEEKPLMFLYWNAWRAEAKFEAHIFLFFLCVVCWGHKTFLISCIFASQWHLGVHVALASGAICLYRGIYSPLSKQNVDYSLVHCFIKHILSVQFLP